MISLASVVKSSDATTIFFYQADSLDMAVLGFYSKDDAANNRSHCQASHRLQDGWSIHFAQHPALAVQAMAQAGSWGGTKLCSVSGNDTFECVRTGRYAGSYADSGLYGEPTDVKNAVINGESIRLRSDHCDYNLIISRSSKRICDALNDKLGSTCSNWYVEDSAWAFHLRSGTQGLAYRGWALSSNSDYDVTKHSGPQVQNVCALVTFGDGQNVNTDCVALQGSSALVQCGSANDDRCSEPLQSGCYFEAFPACCTVSWPYVQNVSCCHLHTPTRRQCYWKELTCYYSSQCVVAAKETDPVCQQPASDQCSLSTWKGWPSTTSTSTTTTTATTKKKCAAEHQLTVSLTVKWSTTSSPSDLQDVVREALRGLLNIPPECIAIVSDEATDGADGGRRLSLIDRKVTVVLTLPLDEFNRAKELFSPQGQAGASSIENSINDKLQRDGRPTATLGSLSVNNDVVYDVAQAPRQSSTTKPRLAEGLTHSEDDGLLTILLATLGACCLCCFCGCGIFITVKLRGRKRNEELPAPKKQPEEIGEKTVHPEDPATPPTARNAWSTHTEFSGLPEVSSPMTPTDAALRSSQDTYRQKRGPSLKSQAEKPSPSMAPPTPTRDVNAHQSQSAARHFAREPDEASPPQLNFISKPAMNAFERSRQHQQSTPL